MTDPTQEQRGVSEHEWGTVCDVLVCTKCLKTVFEVTPGEYCLAASDEGDR